MASYTKKLAPVANPHLQQGEVLLAAVRGMSKGATKGIVGGTAGMVAGGALGAILGGRAGNDDRAAGEAQARDAGLGDLPPQLALGLTDRRLLVFSRSAVSGKAKDLVGEIPRDRIAEIEGKDLGKLSPNRLTVHLTDGTAVDFEVVRIDGYQTIVEAY